MKNLEKAKKLFENNNLTFALVSNDKTITSQKKGLQELILLAQNEDAFFEWSICDKICGRAAAFLFVFMGLKEVHAKKMTKLAIQILDRAEIEFSYDELIDTVLDENMKELDRFEKAVLRSGSAIQALKDLTIELSKL